MKRIILISIVCALGFKGIRAEEGGRVFTPQAGQFSIGFDVSPIFRFAGNMFNGNTNNVLDPISGTPVWDNTRASFLPSASIMGRYMFTDNIAFIGNIGLLGSNVTTRMYVIDDRALALDPLSQDRLIDVGNQRQSGFSMLLGAEYRIGEGRIQGVFGGGFLLATARNRTTFDWANQMTDINHNPTTSWGQLSGGSRTLETFTNEPTLFWGLATHAGVEYFIAPRVSIGAAVHLYFVRERGAQTFTKTEHFSVATNRVETWTELNSPGNRANLWGTENLGGSLSISFYF